MIKYLAILACIVKNCDLGLENASLNLQFKTSVIVFHNTALPTSK